MTVLVIDDDPALRRLLRMTLESDGYDVCTAANGADGLTCIDDAPHPEAILLDLRMPVMDGQTFYRLLRERDEDAPVIVLSASERGDAPPGAQSYMRKPFDPIELLDEVKRVARPDAA